ncbi:RCC1/BLIP-II [Martensiomyces pterosporus]|nr:RCC1/BLIP-II [Martensiomyces pterosporus]
MVCIRALGSNSSGQLATGSLDDAHHLTATAFAQPDDGCGSSKEWKVQGGGNHAFAWSEDGRCLFASGTNKDGELAMGDRSLNPVLWTRVELPGGSVKRVACGWSHTLLLNDLGEVYAAGSASFGQLGAGLPVQAKTSSAAAGWIRIGEACDSESDGRRLPKFVDIACGMRHSLALTDDGRVFGCGANRCGQLGVAPDKKQPNVYKMRHVSEGLPPIAMIACGRSHSILLARDRVTVFVAGQDKHGQCGPSSADLVAGAWRSFQLPSPALKLCSGWEFGAVLLEHAAGEKGAGNIAMWGRADHGQLVAKGSESFSRGLVRVSLDASDIACGSNHTVAVTQGGAVYAWGWNEHGNAGDPSLRDVHAPRCIQNSMESAQQAVRIGCGYGNTYIATESWGTQANGP